MPRGLAQPVDRLLFPHGRFLKPTKSENGGNAFTLAHQQIYTQTCAILFRFLQKCVLFHITTMENHNSNESHLTGNDVFMEAGQTRFKINEVKLGFMGLCH